MDFVKVAKSAKASTLLMICGVVPPAALSFGLAILFLGPLYSKGDLGLLGLFFTCILGITSLPMLARMLGERELIHTPVGEITLSVAVLEDVVSYLLLAITIVLIQATSTLSILWVFLLMVAESLCLFYVARPIIRLVVARGEATNASKLQPATFLFLSMILILFCLCVIVTTVF